MHPNRDQPTLLERSYDEVFSFEVLPASGPETLKQDGDTKDLLDAIPYVLISGVIPPDFVLDEILLEGKADAGMSGGAVWEPYKLSIGSFDLLVKEIENVSENGSQQYRKPDTWVKNYEDWHVWVMYIKHGIPWEEHKRLNDAVVTLEKQMEFAKTNNNDDKLIELHLKLIEAGAELSEFILNNRK